MAEIKVPIQVNLPNDWVEQIVNRLRNDPEAEWVEIIRCRDCKYYIPYEWMFDGIPRSSDITDYAPDEIGCSINEHNYHPDGFCSNAERREE